MTSGRETRYGRFRSAPEKLDNLRDILELKSRRLGSNWYQHEKILGKLLISDFSS